MENTENRMNNLPELYGTYNSVEAIVKLNKKLKGSPDILKQHVKQIVTHLIQNRVIKMKDGQAVLTKSGKKKGSTEEGVANLNTLLGRVNAMAA